MTENEMVERDPQCAALTYSGERCKRLAAGTYCKQHEVRRAHTSDRRVYPIACRGCGGLHFVEAPIPNRFRGRSIQSCPAAADPISPDELAAALGELP